MIVSNDSLAKVDKHWAVLAVGEVERDRGLEVANARLVKQAVGRQMQIDFAETTNDSDLLRRLSLAYEMAAIEGLNAILNPTSTDDELRQQCASGAWRAFEIRRLFNLPGQTEESIFHILHLSALAYCGERWSDLRRWYNENEKIIPTPSVADVSWDQRVLYKLFGCWIRLFRKKGWDDLDDIRYTIIGLREDQKIFESGALNNCDNASDRAMALRLIALYHWAKATELLALYMLQGEPADIATQLDKHFESGLEAATAAHDAQLEVLLRWLHVASRQMVAGSIWWVSRVVNSRVTQFVKNTTKHQALFELLPPQRTALQEQGLLDQASTAVVVEMPTSGGKTLLAQFKILQALNQFDADHGWIAYVAPTRALTAQITRRLRRDFEPIGVQVEQLTGAIEIDTFEDDILSGTNNEKSFDVLVTTPEKLQLIIRNKKISRPLALVVMDEAHNIEDEVRGLRIELLLATIKQEYQSSANFLLLMPYVEKAETLARWLAHDVNAGRTISIGTTPWQPNERIVGIFHAEPDESVHAGWRLKYKTLTTTPKTINLEGEHAAGGVKPLKIPKSKIFDAKNRQQKGFALQTAAMAKIFSERGTSIAVANTINSVWTMARKICETVDVLSPIPDEIELVLKFLKTEISPDFELVNMLSHGVGVHHAGLSDEVRTLIEWLAEEGELRVLCTTTTIAQGINFPVSSVFLSSRFVPHGTYSKEMVPRVFWNLAGRAGRMGHDSVGVVGLAAGNKPEEIVEYVSKTTGELVSRLVNMLDELEDAGRLNDLSTVFQKEQWEDFRCYVAHLWNEKKNLDAVLSETDQLLRNTYGYGILNSSHDGKEKARALLDATKNYARKLSNNQGQVKLADMTGFSPEGVGKALAGLNRLERKLTIDDWKLDSLFGSGNGLADLFGVMLKVPQLKSLTELGGKGIEKKQIADITNAWVSGKSIQDIAQQFFQGTETNAITDACKAIYRNLVNNGTWGLSALSRMAGIDFDSLPESERRRIDALPAMIYHGVKSEEAVLMRMNFAPRSVAEKLGRDFKVNLTQENDKVGVHEAREFLKNMDESKWERVRPEGSYLSGSDYKDIWELLSGEQR
jgi:replicative superfamily II helicase